MKPGLRWLLNHDANGGAGGGAAPQDPGTQAQGASTDGAAAGGGGEQAPAYVTAADLKANLDAMQNSMFANMRRMVDGMNSKGKPAGQTPAAPAPSGDNGAAGDGATPAPAATTDARTLIARERALNDALQGHNLTPAQRDLVRSSVDRDEPATEELPKYLETFTSAFGTGGNANPGAPNVNPPAANPASDAGAPARTNALTSGAPAWEVSQDEVDTLVREKGMYQAGVILRHRLKADLTGRRFYVGRPRQ